MALLNHGPGNRPRPTGVFLALAFTTLVGCVLIDRFRVREEVFGFDHQLHVVDQGMDCLDCHTGAESDAAPGLPPQRACMLCHEDIDAEKPPEERIDQLFVDGVFQPRGPQLSDELRFSHAIHVAADYDCAACHPGMEENSDVGELEAKTMDDCMRCHASEGVANECATCHTEIGRDWAPDEHHHGWIRRHGNVARLDSRAPAQNCALCHTERSCASCHEETPPENHNNFWRLRGHGVAARLDRENCAACHRTDVCNQCHESARPITHRGSFGGTRSNHCLSCHFPLQGEGCFVCHRDAPSHTTATPLPANHSPGFDCRQCHGVTAPLPHVDKGDLCIACHM